MKAFFNSLLEYNHHTNQKSIEAFIQGKDMTETLLKNGFRKALYKTYTLGVCSMYLAEK